MKLHNKSQRAYQHSFYDEENKLQVLYLRPDDVADNIPDDVAKLWLSTGDIVEFADPAEVKEAQAKADEEKTKLENENTKLKEEIRALKEAQAKADEEKLEALKKEADKLEIKYSDNIGYVKLLEKVEAAKNNQ